MCCTSSISQGTGACYQYWKDLSSVVALCSLTAARDPFQNQQAGREGE